MTAVPLHFAGYAAIFHRVDQGGDIVEPGAFAATLAPGRTVPLFLQHRADRPVGQVLTLREDARGLRITGAISDARTAALVRTGALRALSFGYRVRDSAGQGPRRLRKLDLVEVSLVANPMQPAARIIAFGAGASPQAQ